MRLPGLALLLVLASVSVARAEPPPPTQQPAPTPPPFRTTVKDFGVEGADRDAVHNAVLGDTLLVTLGDGEVDQLLRSNESFWLYLNGVAFKDLPMSVEPAAHRVRFTLKRTADNKDLWNTLLSRWQDQELQVAVGQKAGPGLGKDGEHLLLKVYPFGRTAVAIALAVVVVGGVILLGKRTGMLRDPQSAPATADAPATGAPATAGALATAGTPAPASSLKPNERTYSLGRTQMAWWTVMTLLAVLALWAITGSFEKISGAMLTLMGIGAGTFLSAVLIDDAGNRQGFKSENLLKDLLTENDGVSLHRFQMLVWTLVVTVAFWTSVVTRLEMPDIDPTLLGLLGISSGTYLGFKAR